MPGLMEHGQGGAGWRTVGWTESGTLENSRGTCSLAFQSISRGGGRTQRTRVQPRGRVWREQGSPRGDAGAQQAPARCPLRTALGSLSLEGSDTRADFRIPLRPGEPGRSPQACVPMTWHDSGVARKPVKEGGKSRGSPACIHHERWALGVAWTPQRLCTSSWCTAGCGGGEAWETGCGLPASSWDSPWPLGPHRYLVFPLN